jgi:hypothetical protein
MKKFAWILVATLVTAVHGQQGRETAKMRPGWYQQNPVTALTAATFAQPPASDYPWVRLNMPATADPAEIAAEIQDMHDHGIAGVEVGQGAFPSNEQLVALLTKANELGIKVSLSHGPTQNPAGYSIDDDNARKTLAFGSATVGAGVTFAGQLPPPRPPVRFQFGAPPGGRRQEGGAPPAPPPAPIPTAPPRSTLVALLAYRCTATPCPPTGPQELDRSSVIDLTPTVIGTNTDGVLGGTTAGEVRWRAPSSPADAQWQLVAFWSQGAFAQPDPFSEEGLDQLIHSMETALSPEVKKLMKANGGDIFYDSHSSDRGSPDELWTNKMPAEFGSRRGYALIPNLAALFPGSFSFSDGSAPRVRDDLYAVRGDIWIEKQITPLKAWVRKYNYALRVQPEGEMSPLIAITDQVQAAAAMDRPEHESLFTNDEVDNYLPIASANHMTGNPWYSTECCAALNMNYAQTFQDTTIRMHKSFAGGIAKLVYHVYPYRDSATSKWPGFHIFGQAGFSNAWGPREPFWKDAHVYNDYFARNGQVLTQGDAKTDVAVYMQNYLYPQPQMMKGAGFRIWRDTGLQEAGYTRDYLNPNMLDLPNATVTNGRLAMNGPAYKALILDAELQPPTDPVKTSMPVDVARKILGFARAGLPVVIVSTPPDRTPGNTPGSDDALRAVIGELLAERTVYRVAHEADVPGKLRSLGIRPSAEPRSPSRMLSVHRQDPATRTDYYFLYNQGVVSPAGEPANLFEPASGEPLDTEVSLEGSGRPYRMDAWSGKIAPVANYTSEAGRVTLRVRLSRDNAELIALSEDPWRFGPGTPRVHVTGTDADDAVLKQNAVVIRAVKAGTYSTTLSDGRTVRSMIGSVPVAIDLTNKEWRLAVEDWQPANPYAATFGAAAAETLKAPVALELTGLKPWPEIPALQNASGVGTYTTTIDLPAEWTGADGAWLSLGEVFDSFLLTIDGRAVPIDQLSAEGDVGSYLKAGKNTIVVRVATTLNNRLAKIDDDVARRGLSQPYGLVGPVILTPYRQATVWTDDGKRKQGK